MREKLWKLVKEAIHSWESDVNMSDHIADHLIANGVVVSKMETTTKWIPVTERLPKRYRAVIVWTRYEELGEATYDGKHFLWDCDENYADVTHWMPLPEPPKGE